MENCFHTIVGNRKLCSRLADEIRENRFPHAYIIAGNSGSGKRTIALQIAAALACKDRHTLPCGLCESCQKILGGFSPDVLHIRKDDDKKEFTVNLIRRIKDGLYIAPNELEKRVYILEDCETMNANAQNAFLKMLEEPPAYVVFLLLCTNTENLLETIKSRAPILYTEKLPFEEISSYLMEHSPRARVLAAEDPQKLNSIVASADGSIGIAMSLCEESEKHVAMRQSVIEFLQACTSPSLTNLHLFGDRFFSAGNEFSEFLLTLKRALRDVLLLKHTTDIDFMFFGNAEEADAIATRITVLKALDLNEAADDLLNKLKFYLDIKLAAVTFCNDARKIMTK